MSLDVYLYRTVEGEPDTCVYESNITHNLGRMAGVAGLYHACWRPEEINCTQAKHILPLLETGYQNLVTFPEFYKQFNASNGWGMYEHLVEFVKDYMHSCQQYPSAVIGVSR